MGSSRRGSAGTNLTINHEVAGLIPALAQWVKDLALLWLWCWLVATAPIRPLVWEPPNARGEALNGQKDKKKKERKKVTNGKEGTFRTLVLHNFK